MNNSTDKNSNYYFINISLTFAPRIPAKNEMKKTSQSDGHLFMSIFDERFLRSPAAAVICEIEEGKTRDGTISAIIPSSWRGKQEEVSGHQWEWGKEDEIPPRTE